MQFLTPNDSQVKLLPAEEFDRRGNDVRMQWGVRHISRELPNSLQLHSVIYVSFRLIPRKRVYCASIWIHSFWRCVPAISSVAIVSVSPLLITERTNNISGWKRNRFSLIAGSCGMPPTEIKGEVGLEKSQMFIQMLLGFFFLWLLWAERLCGFFFSLTSSTQC